MIQGQDILDQIDEQPQQEQVTTLHTEHHRQFGSLNDIIGVEGAMDPAQHGRSETFLAAIQQHSGVVVRPQSLAEAVAEQWTANWALDIIADCSAQLGFDAVLPLERLQLGQRLERQRIDAFHPAQGVAEHRERLPVRPGLAQRVLVEAAGGIGPHSLPAQQLVASGPEIGADRGQFRRIGCPETVELPVELRDEDRVARKRRQRRQPQGPVEFVAGEQDVHQPLAFAAQGRGIAQQLGHLQFHGAGAGDRQDGGDEREIGQPPALFRCITVGAQTE